MENEWLVDDSSPVVSRQPQVRKRNIVYHEEPAEKKEDVVTVPLFALAMLTLLDGQIDRTKITAKKNSISNIIDQVIYHIRILSPTLNELGSAWEFIKWASIVEYPPVIMFVLIIIMKNGSSALSRFGAFVVYILITFIYAKVIIYISSVLVTILNL
jgi:hypothetical protein